MSCHAGGEHWGAGVATSPELASARDGLIHTIGNLTLITKKLNIALSNRPWSDSDTAGLTTAGTDAGLGKRSLLNRYSLLLLKEDIIDKQAWTEADITARSDRLTDVFIKIWPGP